MQKEVKKQVKNSDVNAPVFPKNCKFLILLQCVHYTHFRLSNLMDLLSLVILCSKLCFTNLSM